MSRTRPSSVIAASLYASLAVLAVVAPSRGDHDCGAEFCNVETPSVQIDALKAALFSDDAAADLNADGIVDFLDLGLLGGSGAVPRRLGVQAAAPGGATNFLFFTLPGDPTPRTGLTVSASQQIFLELRMSFSEVTVGGGIDVLVDPMLLDLVDVIFDMGLGDDIDLRCPTDALAPQPVVCPNNPFFVSFGGLGGITGTQLVATLELASLGSGSSPLAFQVAAPFSDTMGMPLSVPEPALGGLAALLTLGLIRLRHSPTS